MTAAKGRLAGRTALVTGGSRGIGLGIARLFASHGAQVILVSRNIESLQAAVPTIVGDGADADDVAYAAAHADNLGDATAAVRTAVERFGKLDVLVNNAAANPYFGPLLGLDAGAAHMTQSVNLVAPLPWSQLARQHSMRRRGGFIINVASNGGLLVDRNLGWYNTSKAALFHLTRHLAMELAPSVRVNSIAPGLVKTDMSWALWADDDGAASSMPLQRLGEPSDIAEAALYLGPDESAWVTGQNLVVDGGFLVRSVQ